MRTASYITVICAGEYGIGRIPTNRRPIPADPPAGFPYRRYRRNGDRSTNDALTVLENPKEGASRHSLGGPAMSAWPRMFSVSQTACVPKKGGGPRGGGVSKIPPLTGTLITDGPPDSEDTTSAERADVGPRFDDVRPQADGAAVHLLMAGALNLQALTWISSLYVDPPPLFGRFGATSPS